MIFLRNRPDWKVGRVIRILVGVYLAFNLGLSVVWAESRDAGTNNPFDLGVGARAMALGSAYTAVAEDATAIFWNPAGLSRLEHIEIAAMHMQLFFDTPYDYIGLAYPVLDWGTFALGAVRLATSGILVRDDRARIVGTGDGSLDQREFIFAYARDIAGLFKVGIAMKIDQQRLLGDFAMGTGLDAGLLYEWPGALIFAQGADRLSLGISAQNILGSQLRLDEDTDVLPTHWQAGAAYALRFGQSIPQDVLLTVGWKKSTWRESQWSAGLEYTLLGVAAVRAGLNSQAWTCGGGLQYAGVLLDYALSGEALGLTHRVSMSYRFGPSLAEQRQAREIRRQEEMDREAEKRAAAAVEAAQKAIAEEAQVLKRQYLKDKATWQVKQDQRLAQERRLQADQRKKAVDEEYMKAFHYFQGIKDFLDKQYRQALMEFETVAKYDPDYLEVRIYLTRTRQRAEGGGKQVIRPENMTKYYQGIDWYVENKFVEAIGIWEQILLTEPNNPLVLRNIEEARERIERLKGVPAVMNPAEPGTVSEPETNP